MRTGDGFLDFRQNSLKYRIYRYCSHNPGWTHNGTIQKEAMDSRAGEGSTVKRRIQEMVKDGYLKSEYRGKELYVSSKTYCE